jgi:hypothetical protein
MAFPKEVSEREKLSRRYQNIPYTSGKFPRYSEV